MPATLTRSRTQAVEGLFDGLIRIGRTIRARSADWAHAGQDLSRGDVVTLGVLSTHGSLRPSQIAAALHVGPSVVSRQLATLHRLDLVARGTDPEDGRAELITLTEQGRDRLTLARTTMCEVLSQRLGTWDLEEIAGATAMVEDLARLLDDTADPKPQNQKDVHV